MAGENREKRVDLVLPPGTYAYFQDQTKGMVKVYTGPTAVTPSAQEVPVIWSAKKRCFERVELE